MSRITSLPKHTAAFSPNPSSEEFVSKLLPAIALQSQRLQAVSAHSIENLFLRPHYPNPAIPPDHPDHVHPNRLLPHPIRPPLDVDTPIFNALTPTNQKLEIDRARARKELDDYHIAKYQDQQQALLYLKDPIDDFMPPGSAIRKAIAGANYPTYDTIDFADLLLDLKAYFLQDTNINATRLAILAILRSHKIALRKPTDWPAFITFMQGKLDHYNALGSAIAQNDLGNIVLDILKRSTDFTDVPLAVNAIFAYEQAHNNELRTFDAIVKLIASLVPSILTFHGSLKPTRTAYAISDDNSDNDSDAGLLAQANKKKPQSAPKNTTATQKLATTVSVSATDAASIQEILDFIRKKPVEKKQKSSVAVSASKYKPPYVPLRYCYTHGTTSGPAMHTSNRCPDKGPGHQDKCTYANRAEYDGAAPV